MGGGGVVAPQSANVALCQANPGDCDAYPGEGSTTTDVPGLVLVTVAIVALVALGRSTTRASVAALFEYVRDAILCGCLSTTLPPVYRTSLAPVAWMAGFVAPPGVSTMIGGWVGSPPPGGSAIDGRTYPLAWITNQAGVDPGLYVVYVAYWNVVVLGAVVLGVFVTRYADDDGDAPPARC